MEQDRVARAVQQSQQGKWTTWEDIMQQSLTWSDIAFMIKSVYDQLPSRDKKEVEFGGRRQIFLWQNQDTASHAQQLHVCPCQWSVHMAT